MSCTCLPVGRSLGSLRRRALTLIEAITVVVLIAVLLSLILPAVARNRGDAGVIVSLDNLTTLGVSHFIYSADWNGRQVTVIDDAISAFGDDPASAFAAYCAPNCDDPDANHPGAVLGWGHSGGNFTYFAYTMYSGSSGGSVLLQPIAFDPYDFSGFGAFRVPNTRAFHTYVGGRFYDPRFYAPNDELTYLAASPAFDQPWEFVTIPSSSGLGDIPIWSSYCWSPAAHFDPDVMRAESEGGWQDPWSIDHGFRSPALDHARYPDLKTQLLEHNWNQAPPSGCNPSYTPYCYPYQFNHGLESAPAALFYDMSTRLLPNREAVAADRFVREQTGEGLWSRDTPFGADGYFDEWAVDGTNTSHHIFTTSGIRGRDTIERSKQPSFRARQTARKEAAQ